MATNDTQNPETDGLHHVASADELEEGERIIADVEGREVAVFNSNGDLYALSNYCPHQGGPACEGLLSGTLEVDEDEDLVWSCEDEIVACPWHGWEFDVTDGRHTASDKYRLPTYDVREIDGELYVGL
ncbi:Rieske-type iron-sulfur protein (2Fe-2S) [Natrialba magadii ATCC 43099]|uniref:Rieske (2Fe-2S) domain-containing protein n=1 Tax=Natrialba magadii (strain ATCC 43099 / DSM 3394 / CCM 3739 / CIP 104546 / IAM 13178 / JCM 8861 / NBRC 102185 / NCIMB 2190 / MS3) TaxID=547559 RepID=D3SWT2_NATMM|nr:Rieske (2Fe-2S) protein [Natrialba magadii]ADD05814.1 Rieske-type iron-sulfur protein (2Fe-2S) [Natrialba magadii ATCC 43099]ELY30110.1 Rieske (2Fe-2S) domain-containing protein [Natrialba magadii ATCC 43099]